jgi:type I restriction enzyme S subunit
VLGALDDKIASNRRLANVLHETNDAQFWHQFGDLAPGSDGDGKWPVGFLGDLVDVTMGQSPPGSTYTSDPTAGVLLVQGMGGMGNRFPTSQTYTSTPTKHAKAGATLMTVRAPVGAVNVAHVDLCLGRGVAGITSTRPAFTEYMIRSLSGRWAPEESGTIFPAVNKKQITGLTVALPPNSEADAFETFASPFVGKLAALDDETSPLTQILGELLPKLISGEIRVPAGEPDPEALAA